MCEPGHFDIPRQALVLDVSFQRAAFRTIADDQEAALWKFGDDLLPGVDDIVDALVPNEPPEKGCLILHRRGGCSANRIQGAPQCRNAHLVFWYPESEKLIAHHCIVC